MSPGRKRLRLRWVRRASRLWGACLAFTLACAPRPAPDLLGAGAAARSVAAVPRAHADATAAGAEAGSSADASTGDAHLRAADLEGRDHPAALDEAARRWEAEATQAADPAPLQLLAARARRALADRWAARAERATAGGVAAAASGDTARELMLRQAQDAQACAAAARRAWSAHLPAAAAALEAGQPAAEALAQVGAADAEPLYLEALCTAAWARAQGFTFLVDRRAELQALLERAAVLTPELDEAGPDRELGRLLSSLPTYAGGSLREARARFEAALARAPGSVQNRVLFARGVAVKLQDRALFERLLGAALDQPAAAAQERPWADEARALLARADDLFGAAQ